MARITFEERTCSSKKTRKDDKTSIGEAILQQLPSSRKVSKEKPVEVFGAIFTVEWDPLAFVAEQKYQKPACEALATAITLSGCADCVQALTCEEYLDQNWHSSGRDTLEILQTMLSNKTGAKHTSE